MAEHPHGTLARYQSGRCRCRKCRDAKAEYARNRARLIAYGRWQSYVDARPCREHVKALMGSGLTLGRVADLAGLGISTVQKLMTGTRRSGGQPSQRVLAKTAQAILSVRFDVYTLPDTAWVDAAGSRRRVQALMALGYSLKDQAEAVGRAAANYRTILDQEQVLAATARAVRDLYDAWSMTPAPNTWMSERTRRHALKRGWLPPLAWDDDLIDLTDEALAEALRDRVEQMSDAELVRANSARNRYGDKTPLTLEAVREYKRRRYQRRRSDLGEAS